MVCTRPGWLSDGKGGSKVKASKFPNQLPIAFVNLAKFNLEAVLDEKIFGKNP